ncbi:hypothetical protein Poli38472_014648 [Pythium oligandrum]|uniref:Uncharacterized protein n=1 Tax=Pythium oligandrum TaxID=41045 RepID=A0A8K1FMS7_PYTOL|nr:hypothetical protein Poli38472_014648 [Pythium oligandrum]|eukprot:TMW63943.1 hypothetical protein Poli38472_014648 [Pythium oligandrum]
MGLPSVPSVKTPRKWIAGRMSNRFRRGNNGETEPVMESLPEDGPQEPESEHPPTENQGDAEAVNSNRATRMSRVSSLFTRPTYKRSSTTRESRAQSNMETASTPRRRMNPKQWIMSKMPFRRAKSESSARSTVSRASTTTSTEPDEQPTPGNARRSRVYSVFNRPTLKKPKIRGKRAQSNFEMSDSQYTDDSSVGLDDSSVGRKGWKPCAFCSRSFQFKTSKYRDYCSVDCKTASLLSKGAENPKGRACEWI